MKHLTRYLSVLFACLSFVALFSVTANAETIDVSSVEIIQSLELLNSSNTELANYSYIFTTENGVQDVLDHLIYTVSANRGYALHQDYLFKSSKLPFMKKGRKTTFDVYDCYYSYGLEGVTDGAFGYFRNISTVRALITYTDQTTEYIDTVSYSQDGPFVDFSFEFTPKKDVQNVKILVTSAMSTGYQNQKLVWYAGEYGGADKGYTISVDQLSEEGGLLSGIIDWLKGIKEGITNLFNSIAELPAKLWNLISEGLKSLFVPDEQFIVGYKDDWDSLLSSRFGALYEVGQILRDFASNIQQSTETKTISLPKASLESVGIPFSFGPYDIKIVPDGFNILVEACKKIISIVCTLWFINALRKTYDGIMGGKE